jgi:hypothetical protein
MNAFVKITLTKDGQLKEQFINQKGNIEWEAGWK